jgi:hypothetical protein
MASVVAVVSLKWGRKWSYIGDFENWCRVLSSMGFPAQFYTRSRMGQHDDASRVRIWVPWVIRNYRCNVSLQLVWGYFESNLWQILAIGVCVYVAQTKDILDIAYLRSASRVRRAE